MNMNKGSRKFRMTRGKALVLVVSLVLVIGCAVGGTLAWLGDKTSTVTNVFTPSTIDIELAETTTTYKMTPGCDIDKDPEATVKAGSELCYLFVKVEKENNFDNYMDYAIDAQWTKLDGVDGVYYMVINDDSKMGTAYNVLGAGSKTYDNVTYTWADDQVLVKPTVTETQMEEAKTNPPKLKFTAYASQLKKNSTTNFTVDEAWTIAQTM